MKSVLKKLFITTARFRNDTWHWLLVKVLKDSPFCVTELVLRKWTRNICSLCSSQNVQHKLSNYSLKINWNWPIHYIACEVLDKWLCWYFIQYHGTKKSFFIFVLVTWWEFLHFCFGYLMKTYQESNLSRQAGFRPSFLHFSVSKLKLKYLKQLYQFTPKFQIEVECLSMWMPPNMLASSCKAWEKWWDVRGISVANSKQHHTGIKHDALVTSNSGGLWGHWEAEGSSYSKW